MRKFALIAAAVVVASSSAFAGQKQDAFAVKVKITGTCAVVAPDIDFGISETVVAGTTSAATVTVKCSNGLAYSLALDTPTASQMSGAIVANTDKIAYGLAFTTSTGIGIGMGTAVVAAPHTLTATLSTASAPVADDYSQARIVYVNY